MKSKVIDVQIPIPKWEKTKKWENIFGVTKRSNNGITNWRRFYGLQIGASGITNRSNFRDFKSGQKDCKSRQGFQIAVKRFQIGAIITNRDKRDFKLG